jgi:hypothetical protein
VTGRRQDHHPPWSPTSPRTAATRPVRPARAGACSRPRRRRQPPTLRAPAWPAWPRSGQARRRRPPTTPAQVRRPTDQRATSAVSPVRRPPRPSTRPPGGAAATGTSTGCCGDGCPAASTWSQRHRLRWRKRTRPDRGGGQQTGGHRTGGHRTGGHRTGGRQWAGRWTVDRSRPDRRTPERRPRVTGHGTGRTPDGWTAGTQTTNRLGGHPHAGQR